jgi:hypothetical protein
MLTLKNWIISQQNVFIHQWLIVAMLERSSKTWSPLEPEA